MIVRVPAVLAALSVAALPALAAQPAGQLWQARSVTTRSITGDVTFSPHLITFETGASLKLEPAGSIRDFTGFGRSVNASVYRVLEPKDLNLVRNNRLCDGKAVTYVLTWQPAYQGDDPSTRAIAFFSGDRPPATDRGEDTCGTFTYDTRRLR